MRVFHGAAVVLLCVFVSACGGGGGGDGGGDSNLPSISFSSGSLNARFTTGQEVPLTLVATTSDPVDRSVYVTIMDDAGAIAPNVTIAATSATMYSVHLSTAATLAPGLRQGHLAVNLCFDPQCHEAFRNSPLNLQYSFDVLAAFSIQPSVVEATLPAFTTPTVELTLTSSHDLPVQTFFRYSASAPVVAGNVLMLTDRGNRNYALMLPIAPGLTPGVHAGELEVNVCANSDCQQFRNEAPLHVGYRLTVTPPPPPPPPTFAIDVSVGGLVGSGLVLENDNGDELTVTSNGLFSFPTELLAGGSYDVSIRQQPAAPHQSCTVQHGSGTVSETAAATILVTCPRVAKLYVPNFAGFSISGYLVDSSTGELLPISGSPFAAGVFPSSAIATGDGAYLYVVDAGAGAGSSVPRIFAYGVNESGSLTQVAGSPFAVGNAAGAVGTPFMHPSQQHLYLSTLLFPFGNPTQQFLHGAAINGLDGALTPVTGSPYSIVSMAAYVPPGTFNPAGTVLYLPNGSNAGGAIGSVNVYSVDATTGSLSLDPNAPAVSTGGTSPFFARLHPSGQYLYVANTSGSVAAYSIDVTTNALTALAGSPLSTGGSLPTVPVIDPTGRFLYVANANSLDNPSTPATVAAFRIDAGGNLTPIPGSPFATNGLNLLRNPVSAVMHPSGHFLYVNNNGSDTIQAFAIDGTTGVLTEINGAPFNTQRKPTAPVIDESGRFMFVVNEDANTVSAFRIDAATGSLTLVNTLATQASPRSPLLVGHP